MFHLITPWSDSRDFGHAINQSIERLNYNENDWILLKDGDSCFLTSDWGRLINSAIAKYGNQYDLISCATNRLGGNNQSITNNFEEMDLSKHYELAVSQQKEYGAMVLPCNYDIAGFFMLFSIKIWNKVKFKNTLVFDREFTKGVTMAGGRVGIMPGLYVLHCYRLWAKDQKEAKDSVAHLIK